MSCQHLRFDPGFRSTRNYHEFSLINFFSSEFIFIKLKLKNDALTFFSVLIIDINGMTTIFTMLLVDKRLIFGLHCTSSQAMSILA